MPPKELPKGTTGEEPELVKPRRSKFKIIMILGSLLLLLSAIGGGSYWWLYLRPGSSGLSGLTTLFSSSEDTASSGQTAKEEKKAETSAAKKEDKPAPDIKLPLKPMALPPLTVNLSDPSGNRYLKIGLEIELNSEEAIRQLQAQSARVRDSVILLLSSKMVRDLTSSEGKVLLKNEIAARLNQVLGAPRVVRIFFTEFVIQ